MSSDSSSDNGYDTAAEAQFHTSSVYPVPAGYTAWVIRNDYPLPPSTSRNAARATGLPIGQPAPDQSPWLDFKFRDDPLGNLDAIKEYFLEGMIESDFVPQLNTVRFVLGLRRSRDDEDMMRTWIA